MWISVLTILIVLILVVYTLVLFFLDITIGILCFPFLFYFGNRLTEGIQKNKKVYLLCLLCTSPLFFLKTHVLIALTIWLIVAWSIAQLVQEEKIKKWISTVWNA